MNDHQTSKDASQTTSRSSWILRLLGISLVGLVLAAAPANAQLGSITATASAGVPELPQLPAVDQRVDTPLGYADAYLSQDGAHICHDLNAASPVPIPMPLPVPAAASTYGCIDLSQQGLNATLGQNVAGQEIDAGTDGKTGAWAKVTGFFRAAADIMVDLF